MRPKFKDVSFNLIELNKQAEKRNRRALPLVKLACRLTRPAPQSQKMFR